MAPIAGPLFVKASRLRIKGRKRRKLLCLLAAYADAGEVSPPMRDVASRMKLPGHAVDSLLDLLITDGWLEVEWAAQGPPGRRNANGSLTRNRYTLRFSND